MMIRLFDIGWDATDENGNDTDGSRYGLPEEVVIENPSSELLEAAERMLAEHEAAEELEEYLSGTYEFCVYEFGVEILRTQGEIDTYMESKWEELVDVMFDEDADGELVLADDWYVFAAGTGREEIWHWFDERYSKGVAVLLYGEE